MNKRPFLIGLTGSIGMGKTTTAAMFAELGVAVWGADAAVHRLYNKGGAAVESLREIYPNAIINDAVDRNVLKERIALDPSALKKIEAMVHPLVATDRAAFIENTKANIVVLDIPLLFETGADAAMDVVVVVTAPSDIQRQRVMERQAMTETQFQAILAKQMPDAEKRVRADYVIETTSLEGAKAQVKAILEQINA